MGLGLAVLFQRSFPRQEGSLFRSADTIDDPSGGRWLHLLDALPVEQASQSDDRFRGESNAAALDWLRESHLAFLAVIITEVWHWTPLFFLILYSGSDTVRQSMHVQQSFWVA